MNIIEPPVDDAKEITFSQLSPLYGEDGEEMSYQDAMDYRAYDADTGLSDSDEYCDDAGHLYRSVSGRAVSSTVTSPDDEWPDAEMKIDWDKVADAAQLDDGEHDILEFRLMGFNRDEILDELAESEQDRLELQASWRRLGRQFGRIKETLSASGE